MELIASSRIVKAQQRVEAALPYTRELIRAISAAASHTGGGHPLTQTEQRMRERAAVLIVTSDRGLAGAYSSATIKEGEQLTSLLREQGVTAVPFLVGRKAVGYYRFRGREVAASWTGFTDQPDYAHAKEIADGAARGVPDGPPRRAASTRSTSSTRTSRTWSPRTVRVRRVLPLEVVEQRPAEAAAAGRARSRSTSSSPAAQAVLDSLLPKYIENVVFSALLLGAASEHAARRRAMKAATDNAEELIKTLTRQANQARQAEITQEISEIVGGADALSASA